MKGGEKERDRDVAQKNNMYKRNGMKNLIGNKPFIY